jgi:hypothetical protein
MIIPGLFFETVLLLLSQHIGFVIRNREWGRLAEKPVILNLFAKMGFFDGEMNERA